MVPPVGYGPGEQRFWCRRMNPNHGLQEWTGFLSGDVWRNYRRWAPGVAISPGYPADTPARPPALILLLLVRMGQATPSIYRPRRPERTDLHPAVRENLDLFLETYYERFFDQHGPLTARARHTLDGYLRCSTLSAGFARVRCGDCADRSTGAHYREPAKLPGTIAPPRTP